MWTLRKRIDQNRNSNQADLSGAESGSAINNSLLTPAARQGHRLRASRGQTLLEFALVVPMFLMLLCGVVDFSRLFYVEMTLQNAVRQAGRFATTGQQLTDSSGNAISRANSITQIAQQAAGALNLTSNSINISSGGTGGTGAAANPGGPGSTVTISMTTGLPILTPIIAAFFPNGTYNFTVSATFKNEPFTPSPTS